MWTKQTQGASCKWGKPANWQIGMLNCKLYAPLTSGSLIQTEISQGSTGLPESSTIWPPQVTEKNTTWHCIAWNCIALHDIAFHCIALYSLFFSLLLCLLCYASPCFALFCFVLFCSVLLGLALFCIALHYINLYWVRGQGSPFLKLVLKIY